MDNNIKDLWLWKYISLVITSRLQSIEQLLKYILKYTYMTTSTII